MGGYIKNRFFSLLVKSKMTSGLECQMIFLDLLVTMCVVLRGPQASIAFLMNKMGILNLMIPKHSSDFYIVCSCDISTLLQRNVKVLDTTITFLLALFH